MKNILIVILLSSAVSISFGQSQSFKTLSNKFADEDNVFTIKTSGLITRSVLKIAGEDDVRDALRDIKKVRMIVIPEAAFHIKDVSPEGFIKYAQSTDGFEEVLRARDGKENVTLLVKKGTENKQDRYLFVIDSGNEIVVAEMKGTIDYKKMFEDSKNVKYSKSSI